MNCQFLPCHASGLKRGLDEYDSRAGFPAPYSIAETFNQRKKRRYNHFRISKLAFPLKKNPYIIPIHSMKTLLAILLKI